MPEKRGERRLSRGKSRFPDLGGDDLARRTKGINCRAPAVFSPSGKSQPPLGRRVAIKYRDAHRRDVMNHRANKNYRPAAGHDYGD